MPLFIDTRGKTSLGIGICGRCSRKFPLEELRPDPNSPGLRVCKDDLDDLDPWRLSPRESDQITLEFPRPDVKLSGPTVVVWSAKTSFPTGTIISPINPWLDTSPLPVYQFLATSGGVSGAVAPSWPSRTGVVVSDGTVVWRCVGIYLG